MSPTPSSGSLPRARQVDPDTKLKPRIVDRLNDWQYVERALHRIAAAWGRHIAGWNDKSALHHHVWQQAECVRRLRDRIAQFPGGKPDAPVSSRLEALANAVLLAPSLDDALDGSYLFLSKALMGAYVDYAGRAHSVHDAPTLSALHEINQIKSAQWLWFRDYRRRHPHTTSPSYRERLARHLAECGHFSAALPVAPGEAARPAGAATDFHPPKFSARDFPLKPKHEFMDYVRADFRTSLEARRLFWAYGYMMEKNLPDDQLLWLYYGHDLPWDWHHDVSRHLWDESRHGDSGYSRLQDFGISLAEVGFPSYNNEERLSALRQLAPEIAAAEPGRCIDRVTGVLPVEPLSPQALYESVFHIGMVAETGHFIVKNEAYQDFRDGHDLESAEMMLFDIIDETTHVQYAHRWLPVLARRAGIDAGDYRERGARLRAEKERGEQLKISALRLVRDPHDPAFAFYSDLLARIRAVAPLANAADCPPRSPKPM